MSVIRILTFAITLFSLTALYGILSTGGANFSGNPLGLFFMVIGGLIFLPLLQGGVLTASGASVFVVLQAFYLNKLKNSTTGVMGDYQIHQLLFILNVSIMLIYLLFFR